MTTGERRPRDDFDSVADAQGQTLTRTVCLAGAIMTVALSPYDLALSGDDPRAAHTLSVLRDALLDLRPAEPVAGRASKLPHERLSSREREVFFALARGRSPSEIAWDLAMAPSTVSTHLKAIREKLGVRSTFDIAQYAARHGITGALTP